MSDAPLQGKKILVVEDEYLVAQTVVDLLEDAGAEVLGPLGWIEDALDFIAAHDEGFDGAVLDVNLHGRKSYPVADALQARHISFIFATGYGAKSLEGGYRNHPHCEKPFNQKALVKALNGVKT